MSAKNVNSVGNPTLYQQTQALLNAPKGKKPKEPKKPLNSTSSSNAAKITDLYLGIHLQDINQGSTLLMVPCKLLTQEQLKALAPFAAQLYPGKKGSFHARAEAWSKDASDTVDEVQKYKPLRTYRHLTGPEFCKKFSRSFAHILEWRIQTMSNTPLGVISRDKRNIEQESKVQVSKEVPPKKQMAHELPNPIELQEITTLGKLDQKAIEELTSIADSFRGFHKKWVAALQEEQIELSPRTYLRVWGVKIPFALIRRYCKDPEERLKAIKIVLNGWIGVERSLVNAHHQLYVAGNLTRSKEEIQQEVMLLEEMLNELTVQGAKKIAISLRRFTQPLISYLRLFLDLESPPAMGYWFIRYRSFVDSLIYEVCNFKVELGLSLSVFKTFITNTLEEMESYVKMVCPGLEPLTYFEPEHLDAITHESVSLISLEEICQELQLLAVNEDWISLGKRGSAWYHRVDLYINIFEPMKPMESSLKGEVILTNAYSDDMHKRRCFCLSLRDLVETVRNLLYDPSLFKAVTQESLQDLGEGLKTLEQTLAFPSEQLSPIKQWAFELKGQEIPLLAEALADLQKAWMWFRAEFPSLLSDEDKENVHLVLQIAGSNQVELAVVLAGQLRRDLLPKKRLWMEKLRELNLLLQKVQEVAFLIQTDQELPKLDLEMMRNQFEVLNSRLKMLLLPAIQIFTSIDRFLKLQPSQSEHEEKILASFVEEEIVVKLLSHDTEVFKQFGALLKKKNQEKKDIPPKLEAHFLLPEKPPVALPLVQESQSPETISEKIETLFEQTKTYKIVSGLVAILKESKIHYDAKWGKGHLKVYINGELISLPTHKEWAPGMHHATKTKVLDALQ